MGKLAFVKNCLISSFKILFRSRKAIIIFFTFIQLTNLNNMMKKFTLICSISVIFILISEFANAQYFEQGNKFVQAGIGFGSPFYVARSNSTLPPVHASFEMAITEAIGVGGLIGYTASKYDESFFGTSYSWKYSYLIIGARGAYHFHQFIPVENLDVYGGVMLGYNIANIEYTGPNNSIYENNYNNDSHIVLAAFAGARYGFSDQFYVMGEIGYSIAWLSVGAGLKF